MRQIHRLKNPPCDLTDPAVRGEGRGKENEDHVFHKLPDCKERKWKLQFRDRTVSVRNTHTHTQNMLTSIFMPGSQTQGHFVSVPLGCRQTLDYFAKLPGLQKDQTRKCVSSLRTRGELETCTYTHAYIYEYEYEYTITFCFYSKRLANSDSRSIKKLQNE